MFAHDGPHARLAEKSLVVTLMDDEIDAVSGALSSTGWNTLGTMLLGAAGVAGAMGAEPVAAGLGIIGIGSIGIGYLNAS